MQRALSHTTQRLSCSPSHSIHRAIYTLYAFRTSSTPGQVLARGARGSRLLREVAERQEEDVEAALPVVTKIEWTPPLSVLKYPDPKLRALNARVGVFDEDLKQLASEMFDLMYQDDGCGLAAPQVGVNIRMMVFNEAGQKGHGQEIVLVNPKIMSVNQDLKVFEEGCLSFPGMYADVVRPTRIKIKAQDLTGKKFTVSLNGLPARIFQHEFDHLESALYIDRMEPEVLQECKPQLARWEEEYLKQFPGATIQRVT